MSISVMMHHRVSDYEAWRTAFDTATGAWQQAGECSCHVFSKMGHTNDVTVLLEWNTRERAEQFLNADKTREWMHAHHVVGAPDIHYMTEMVRIRRTAAD